MKLLDKLKNAFFEEVEEDDDTIEVPKTFAKKVEVPKKKTSFFKKDDDIDDDFLNEQPKEEKKEEVFEFKNDKRIVNNYTDETQEIPVAKEVEEEVPKTVPMVFDEEDFESDIKEDFSKSFIEVDDFKEDKRKNDDYQEEYHTRERLYPEKNDNRDDYSHDYISNMRESNNNYSYSRKEYNKKEEVRVFKPSPIISPIYGILDKNYRKEEVISKRETRISTTTYKKPDLDSVRNRAFASIDEEKEVTKPISQMEKKKDNRKVYDVNNSKPQVSKVTLADADEYYNDLGLAYNVDYSDASRGNTRSSKYNAKDKKNDKKDVDDSLFDLIDSMYSKEE